MNSETTDQKRVLFYQNKWDKIKTDLPIDSVTKKDSDWIRDCFIKEGLSYSQAKQLCDIALRLNTWHETPIHQWNISDINNNFWNELQNHWQTILSQLPDYRNSQLGKEKQSNPDKLKFTHSKRDGKFLKICPAYSEAYSCCGLEVINVVENCAYACSYCVLHNFYDDKEIRITENLAERLDKLEIDPHSYHRVGTGEYSDSLLWGNKDGILDTLMNFAKKHPNICLELKTKSINIDWLLNKRGKVPNNVLVSWSLNPDTIIKYEEHGTPKLEARLSAARKLADAGIFIGFNFHPMIRYVDFENEYPALTKQIMSMFRPEEVLLISIGSLSFLKQQQDKLIEQFPSSLLLKSKLENKGDNKVGYPRSERIELYRLITEPLKAWQKQVFQYLCMESKDVFEEVLGFSYPSSKIFHEEMNGDIFAKIANKT